MFSGNNPNGEGFKQFGFGMHNLSSGTAAATTLSANGPGSSGGGIDWAQLAQQWIQMRDTSPAAAGNMNLESQNYCLPAVAPPPPIISTMPAYKATVSTLSKQNKHHHSSYEEQGEADMEMDEENDSDNYDDVDNIAPAAPIITQQQWFGDGSSGVETATNHHSPHWNVWPPRVNVPPPPPIISNAAMTAAAAHPTAHIPSLLKINVTNPNAPTSYNHVNTVVATSGMSSIIQSGNGTDFSYSNTSGIDAHKRKMLPAWIREGLEKMEREKHKQMERQQQPKGNDSSNIDEYENTIITSHINPNHSPPVNLLQNIATSASESESGNESEDHHTDNDDDKDNDAASMDRNEETQQRTHQQQSIGKSYEQKLTDLMFVVRRTLTELLLETTNEEIANVAHEAIKSHRKKASSAQVIRKSALSSITGKLGLAAYADSSSDDSSADDSDNNDDDDNKKGAGKKSDSYDSGEDLKATIRNKKRAFAKTIEEIEMNIAQAEEREEQQLKYFKQLDKERATTTSDIQKRKYDELELNKRSNAGRGNGGASSSGSNSKSTNSDFGETTTTTTDSKFKQQFNGKRMKERTTRFSDNKDGKNATASAYNAAATSYINHLQKQQQQSAISTASNGNNNKGIGSVGAGTLISNQLLQQQQQQQKSMPIPNPATALLQMPESMAHYTAAVNTNIGVVNMLTAADAAALVKAATKQASNKSSKSSSSTTTTDRGRHKKKTSRSSSSHRRHRRSNRRSSDDSSSSSSSSSSSTATDKNDDNSNDVKSSRSSSSSSSSHKSKLSSRASSSKHQTHHQQRHRKDDDDDYRRQSSSRQSSSYHGSSNSKYDKGSKDRDRDRDYERRHDRDRRHRDRSHERYAASKSTSSSKRSRRRYSSESDDDDDDYRSSSRRHNHRDKRGSRSRSRSRSNYSSSRSSQRRRH